MKCDEAAELVSALCDRETVSPEVAEHIGTCAVCRARLRDYVEMGAEMRRLASLETEVANLWESPTRGLAATWWRKGWEAMRIPRFAFALLVVGIVGLGSGLAVEGVRAHSTGSVVLLRVGLGSAEPAVCALSTVDKGYNSCSGFLSSTVIYQVTLLSREGDRVNLGVQAKSLPLSVASETALTPGTFEAIPEQQHSFAPGETLKVAAEGGGTLAITGEWMDHLPAGGGWTTNYDPGVNELRVMSPLLLRNNQIAGDVEGGSAIIDELAEAVFLYVPGQGSFAFSLSPMPGAVRGQVNVSRLKFEVNGQHYALLTGAPITRAKEIWVVVNPEFRPPENLSSWFISTTEASEVRTAFQTTK